MVLKIQIKHDEEGIEVPYDQINPEALQNTVEEFCNEGVVFNNG